MEIYKIIVKDIIIIIYGEVSPNSSVGIVVARGAYIF